jgi:hypothetical protein
MEDGLQKQHQSGTNCTVQGCGSAGSIGSSLYIETVSNIEEMEVTASLLRWAMLQLISWGRYDCWHVYLESGSVLYAV